MKSASSLFPCLLLVCTIFFGACPTPIPPAPPPPEPFGPLPSEAQLGWQQMEFNAFVHFNMNTFTDKEWGYGDESPETFNPTDLDTRQWCKVFKEAGMKGVILTAKHHDGFCLWPSQYTEHSVKNSPWKNGQGDVVQELADACKEYGLKLGLYLSPWDRNHPDYGRPEYLTYFRNQLTELLTNYGEIFEVWFDGANGGDGYYGGAREHRKIEGRTYYGWDETYALVKKLQPNAVIFGDGGPGVRWVGNEEGWANRTNWSLLRRDEVWPGYPNYKELRSGHADGTHWVPAECDVSIRPGWYYHPAQDSLVKSLPDLLDIYYRSVGRNGLLLLNFPVDIRGQVHPADVAAVNKLAAQLQKDFAVDLGREAAGGADTQRGPHQAYSPGAVVDGDPETYWTTDDSITTASVRVHFFEPTTFDRLVIQEYIRLGQRVEAFSIDIEEDSGEWREIYRGTTIGYKRILRLPAVTTGAVRLNILQSRASPVISTISVYHAGES